MLVFGVGTLLHGLRLLHQGGVLAAPETNGEIPEGVREDQRLYLWLIASIVAAILAVFLGVGQLLPGDGGNEALTASTRTQRWAVGVAGVVLLSLCAAQFLLLRYHFRTDWDAAEFWDRVVGGMQQSISFAVCIVVILAFNGLLIQHLKTLTDPSPNAEAEMPTTLLDLSPNADAGMSNTLLDQSPNAEAEMPNTLLDLSPNAEAGMSNTLLDQSPNAEAETPSARSFFAAALLALGVALGIGYTLGSNFAAFGLALAVLLLFPVPPAQWGRPAVEALILAGAWMNIRSPNSVNSFIVLGAKNHNPAQVRRLWAAPSAFGLSAGAVQWWLFIAAFAAIVLAHCPWSGR